MARAPLTVEPLGGLCNRMRVIAAGYGVAQAVDRPLHIAWRCDSSLNCSFTRLFAELPPKCSVEELTGLPRGTQANARSEGRVITQEQVDDLIAQEASWIQMAKREPLHIVTWQEFYWYKHRFEMLPPNKQLLDRAKANVATRPTPCTGVHVRRTDHREAMAYSSVSDFIAVMRSMLLEGTSRSFFLATDCPAAERQICAELADHVFVYAKESRDRDDARAIEDAMIDLLTLSRLPMIVGSYRSSFTQTACRLAGIRANFPSRVATSTAS